MSTTARGSDQDDRPRRGLRRALPVHGLLRLRPVADTWRWSALSALIAIGVPELVLLALGHLELALYTSAGGLCALYAHGLPYAARARTLIWVVLGMTAGTAVASLAAALIDSAALKVAVIALLAGLFKVGCDATRVGPPGNVVLTFVVATAAFVPARLGDLPLHLALVLFGGALAWLVCLAPSMFRPHAPERLAVARALTATERLLRSTDDGPAGARLRYEAAAAVYAAWQTLRLVPAGAAERAPLARLVARAESCAAARRFDQADTLAEWARELRRPHGIPVVRSATAEEAEMRGAAVEYAADSPVGGLRGLLAAFAPRSPLLPIGLRVALGGAAAGWTSMALGVERPYWAVLTAVATYVANTALTWQRAVLRVLGSLGGVLLFTALAPLLHSAAALVAVSLICLLATEATISRNYGLAMIFVTPMALAMSEFVIRTPAHRLVLDRWLDTCVGAAIGIVFCFLIPNRRVSGRVTSALRTLEAATATAPTTSDPTAARTRLTAALIETREATDIAVGEWWSAPLPEERIVAAERAGHRALADLTTRSVAIP
ncbi:FUSC family protein [Nocardia pseudobrasiliensis]|uniref:Fusaric acid resistance family protein n=1 Tax=Nocardia pseudobrasiliensis TaxID=45979 RepID=A0A370I7J7_9NOCA|nr:FUSC family protein [Nocardia pseudobrasiliensis]RDI66697.1 fusaric acid resistance family protein [Nocardia pseudobrasiliensis]